MTDTAVEIYRAKERLREGIAEITIRFWKENGVLNHYHLNDYYKVKEEIMKCLQGLGMP